APGLLDWEFYGDVIPAHLLRGGAPQDVASAAFVVGHPCPGGYLSGVLAATYPAGRGRLVVSTFDLLRHQGTPVADQLIRNLTHYAAGWP
ncbi:MAG TPA: hypothetical protein VH089_09595, partial [Streptosporangiaceae bacterium]|nr:hypothetical protein [Streptosporangiaceae bacterium]